LFCIRKSCKVLFKDSEMLNQTTVTITSGAFLTLLSGLALLSLAFKVACPSFFSRS
jgi:hypothetical protein